MLLDDAGVNLITKHEGLRLSAYWDSHGKTWTVGYGHTATAKRGMKISKAQAVELFRQDIARFEDCVNDAVNVEINQGMFNALVSLAYNLGCGGFRRSSLLEALNKGDYKAAQMGFRKYVKAGGSVLAGLVTRRKAEAEMFAQGHTNQPSGKMFTTMQWIFGGSVPHIFKKPTEVES